MDNGNQRVHAGRRTRVEPGLQEHTYPPNRQSLPGQEMPSGLGSVQRWVVGSGGAALLWYGLRREGASRWPLLLLGSALLYQGASGQNLLDHVPGVQYVPVVRQMTSVPSQLRVRKTLTVNRPAHELYSYWRKLENLPRFMQHVRSVQPLDDRRSHWVVDVLENVELEWDAEITEERPDEMIAWQTLPDAQLQSKGYVKFIPTARGTEVSVSMSYEPPAALLGRFVGSGVRFIAEQQIKEEIRNFKRLMETGEIATTDGQPAARPEAWRQSAPPRYTGRAQVAM